jgi:dethiobiotin synthetase
VIVARRGLGTLNHTLLTVEAAQNRGLRVAGVVLNGSEPTTNLLAEATNPEELSRRLGEIPILADLPHASSTSSMSVAMHGVDWWGMAKPSRLLVAASRS